MPSRPGTTPSWGTDANYPAGTDPWSSTPTRVAPTSGEQAAGYAPKDEPPAQWLNWLWGFAADWIAYFAAIIDSNEEHTYQTAKSRTIYVGVNGGEGTEAGWAYGVDRYLVGSGDSDSVFLDIGKYLPSGAILKEVHALIKPGTARSSGGSPLHRMSMLVHKLTGYSTFVASDIGYTQLGSTQTDDGTANRQLLSATGLTEVIGRSTTVYQVEVAAGDTASSNNDRFHGLKLVFDDPGPRNA